MHITKTICALVCISLSTNAFSSENRLAAPSRDTATTLLAATVLISAGVAGGYYYGSRRCQQLQVQMQLQIDQDSQTISRLQQQINALELRERQLSAELAHQARQQLAVANQLQYLQAPVQIAAQPRDTLGRLVRELNTAHRIAGVVAPVVSFFVSYWS